MITVIERKGKFINELSMMDLIEEYKAINLESGSLVMNAFKFEINEDQKIKLEEHCREYNEYQQDLAKEFIQRFIK